MSQEEQSYIAIILMLMVSIWALRAHIDAIKDFKSQTFYMKCWLSVIVIYVFWSFILSIIVIIKIFLRLIV